MLLIYLIGYVGINLYTMGKALHYLVGVDILTAAMRLAFSRLRHGADIGHCDRPFPRHHAFWPGLLTSAWRNILTERAVSGTRHAGTPHGPSPTKRQSQLSTVGIFKMQLLTPLYFTFEPGNHDALLIRQERKRGQKALIATVAILMPVAAIVVASGGWIGSAMQSSGMLPPDVDSKRVFFIVADIIAVPGVFGLVMAALTAALMSTVDTLITAVAAVAVNDVYKPYVRNDAPDAHYLKAARYTSIGATLIGILLVPVFDSFGSIYSARGVYRCRNTATCHCAAVSFLCRGSHPLPPSPVGRRICTRVVFNRIP